MHTNNNQLLLYGRKKLMSLRLLLQAPPIMAVRPKITLTGNTAGWVLSVACGPLLIVPLAVHVKDH